MRFRLGGWSLGVTSLLITLACGSEQAGDDDDDDDDSPGIAGSSATGGTNATGGAGGTGGATATGGSASGGTAGSGAASSSGGSAGMASSVTWAEHVAPLVFRECAGCHRPGGIAPFSLTNYADAKRNADAIADATAVRYMPPMPVDNSGDCNTYSNARWLTDAEIALLGAWADAGAPEGDPARAPAVPSPPLGLGRVDITLDAGVPYTPNASSTDDYRCFVVDPGLTSETYLTGYEVVPGDPRIVHHVIVYAPDSDEAAAEAQALDDAEPGAGYTCFGAARVSATPVVLWAPGGGPTQLPADTGLPLAAGRQVVMQVHYNVRAGTYPDQTTVRLQTAATVAHPAAFLPVANTSLNVPAGQELALSTRTFILDDFEEPLDVVIRGVLPHMHTLGRTLELQGNIGAANRCLVNVDRWDFNWQNAWWYDTPLTGIASILTLSCGYDTRGRTEAVTWGEGTADEMCLAYLYVTANVDSN